MADAPTPLREPPPRTRDPRDAVRTGYDRHPLTDLYFHLMNGGWWRVLTFMTVAYLAVNAVFATVYNVAGGVHGHEEGDWLGAFFFSVQSMSTIGYGAMYPESTLANVMVTVEALVGMLGVAVATGLVFTKFARPRARVLFSDRLLLTRWDGKPALIMRVANARGNDVVEASLRLSVLIRGTTAEGQTFSRLHDLELKRSRTPVFLFSWLVVHEIDENSPLYGYNRARAESEKLRFIVTLTGIDGTFNDMVHANRLYDAQDIEENVLFEDVIDMLPDGRMHFDLGKFHTTIPLPAAAKGAGDLSPATEPSSGQTQAEVG